MPSPLTKVIYAHGGGRFGNQMLRFMHWIAWARSQETPVEVIDLPFWPYGPLFDTWAAHPGCVYPVRAGWPDRIARIRHRMPAPILQRGEWRGQRAFAKFAGLLGSLRVATVRLADGAPFDLADPAFLDRAKRARCLVCTGWQFSAWRQLEQHADDIRKLFTPAPAVARRANEFLAMIRQRCDVVAGLFVRRGDYREWAGGRFFFPLESYARWAGELVAMHPGRRVGIVVASDEPIPRAVFEGSPVVLTTGCVGEGGHWFESFLELAGCDLIASPPSTFSACAAFLGERPLWPLGSPDQSLAGTTPLLHHLFDAARHPFFSTAVK